MQYFFVFTPVACLIFFDIYIYIHAYIIAGTLVVTPNETSKRLQLTRYSKQNREPRSRSIMAPTNQCLHFLKVKTDNTTLDPCHPGYPFEGIPPPQASRVSCRIACAPAPRWRGPHGKATWAAAGVMVTALRTI